MRVRLLIDVIWPDTDITGLGELASRQPPAVVTLERSADFDETEHLGRLMGATLVEVAD